MTKGSGFRVSREAGSRSAGQGSIFWLLILGSWTLSLIFFPSPSLADCRNNQGGALCQGRSVCSTDNTKCCSTPAECPGPTAAPAPAGSGGSAFCDGDVTHGVSTAIGCLFANEPTRFIGQLLGWGVGVGGGIAFLLIVYSGFMIVTAAGDPKRVQAARELFTSALGGLILIVLSVLLLNFIGVNVLGLNGLGFKIP